MADPTEGGSGSKATSGDKAPTKAYKYIGPAAGAKGKRLSYPGMQTISPSKMTDAQIAALEASNPELFKKLWESK